MSSYLNATTGECISGTCQSLTLPTGFDQVVGINPIPYILLFCGVVLLLGMIVLFIQDLKKKKIKDKSREILMLIISFMLGELWVIIGALIVFWRLI